MFDTMVFRTRDHHTNNNKSNNKSKSKKKNSNTNNSNNNNNTDHPHHESSRNNNSNPQRQQPQQQQQPPPPLQHRRITVNAGGRLYETTIETLLSSKTKCGLFYEKIQGISTHTESRSQQHRGQQKHSNQRQVQQQQQQQQQEQEQQHYSPPTVLFIDCDSDLFTDILFFLRRGCLPAATRVDSYRLQDLTQEAEYLKFPSLIQTCRFYMKQNKQRERQLSLFQQQQQQEQRQTPLNGNSRTGTTGQPSTNANMVPVPSNHGEIGTTFIDPATAAATATATAAAAAFALPDALSYQMPVDDQEMVWIHLPQGTVLYVVSAIYHVPTKQEEYTDPNSIRLPGDPSDSVLPSSSHLSIMYGSTTEVSNLRSSEDKKRRLCSIASYHTPSKQSHQRRFNHDNVKNIGIIGGGGDDDDGGGGGGGIGYSCYRHGGGADDTNCRPIIQNDLPICLSSSEEYERLGFRSSFGRWDVICWVGPVSSIPGLS